MGKTCLDSFDQIIRITNTIAALCGCDCVKKNYKKNALTWFVIISINIYFLCTIYTIYVGFIINGNWKIVLETLSLSGSAIQGYSKMLLGIKKRLIVFSMYEQVRNIYLDYQHDKDFLEVLRYRIELTKRILKAVVMLYGCLVVFVIVYPLIYGYMRGEKLMIMAFYIPGIDPATPIGLLIHNVVHAFLITLGGAGNFAGDMYIFILIIHLPLFMDVLKVKCEKLNKVIRKSNKAELTMPLLTDIVKCHQNYNTYTEVAEKTFFEVIIIQIFTSVVSICCTLFSIIIKSWPAAFAYLMYSAAMTYTFCGLGHLVEVSNDEVCNVIYGECLWYELTVPEQKLVLLMLRKAQVPNNLTIAQVMPLAMSTALKLTKTIYSYMMMLINFLE